MAPKSMATTILTCALVAMLAGCKSYVIDFEGKLPDGTVMAPKPTAPPCSRLRRWTEAQILPSWTAPQPSLKDAGSLRASGLPIRVSLKTAS